MITRACSASISCSRPRLFAKWQAPVFFPRRATNIWIRRSRSKEMQNRDSPCWRKTPGHRGSNLCWTLWSPRMIRGPQAPLPRSIQGGRLSLLLSPQCCHRPRQSTSGKRGWRNLRHLGSLVIGALTLPACRSMAGGASRPTGKWYAPRVRLDFVVTWSRWPRAGPKSR